jgi:hypothetical protein
VQVKLFAREMGSILGAIWMASKGVLLAKWFGRSGSGCSFPFRNEVIICVLTKKEEGKNRKNW